MTKFDRSLAVVIGINDYKNGIAFLKTAVPDAVAIATILRDTYQYQLIHPNCDPGGVIANKHATLQNLKTLLTETLPNQIKPTKRDRLLFYFAGHGVALNNDDGPAGFLVPQDADLKSNDTLIPMRTLYKTLESLNCHHLLVILDCCFAGTFRWSSIRKLIPLPQIITKTHYDRFIKSSAWQAITSAAHNQEAFDFIRDNRGIANNSKHSPFAQALLEALQGEADIIPPAREGKLGGDGVITATELYLYLRDRVELDSQDRQTPGIWTLPKHDRGEYIFLVPKSKLDLAETPELNEDNNPYRGLKPFDEQHSRFFFGREELVQELAQCLSEQEHRLSVVLGASGSGKSSLVRAGLISHLRKKQEKQWQILKTMRPGGISLCLLSTSDRGNCS